MFLDFVLRASLSGLIAALLYLVSAGLVSRFFDRKVSRSVLRHDMKLGFVSLLFGSPVIQGFALLAERYHFGFMYTDMAEKGWLYWALSLPLYVLLWDAVFYATHLVLHLPIVYRKSHFRHHACRPPVPWSGIAIDPFETILSGIMPYTIPLLIAPFHIYTVYALNIVLMFWATIVHSSMPWSGSAVFMTPRDHNLHHAFGLKNVNYAAVFTFWDRLFGTLNRKDVPPWWGKDFWRPRGNVAQSLAQSVEGSAMEEPRPERSGEAQAG
jgi:Delta7-sterol 5-desaturase